MIKKTIPEGFRPNFPSWQSEIEGVLLKGDGYAHQTTVDTGIYIPKIIHFIWAGGQRLMPENGIKVMLAWAKQNPEFSIWLWVDGQTSPMLAKRSRQLRAFADAYYEKLLCALPIVERDQLQVLFQNYRFGTENPKIAPFIIKDINQEKVCTSYIRHEIARLQPNYGASSDLLRYRILEKFGGAYFDPDIAPADQKKIPQAQALQNLDMFYPKYLTQHILFIEHITQVPYADTQSEELNRFEISAEKKIGNDSFLVTKNNPLMKLFYTEALKNYYVTGLIEKIDQAKVSTDIHNGQCTMQEILKLKFTYGANDREFYALNLTGPLHVRATLLGKKLKLQLQKNEILVHFKNRKNSKHFVAPVLLKPLRSRDYCLVEPLKNTLNWLNVFVSPTKNVDTAVARVLATIKFEAKHFGILRLDDHIDDLVAAVQHVPVDSKKAINKLFLELRKRKLKLIWNSVDVVQMNFSHVAVNKLYQKMHVWQKTGLMDGRLNTPAHDDRLSFLIEFAASHQLVHMVIAQLANGNEIPLPYTVAQKEYIISYFMHGLQFLDGLLSNGTLQHMPQSTKTCQHVMANYERFYQLLSLDHDFNRQLMQMIDSEHADQAFEALKKNMSRVTH